VVGGRAGAAGCTVGALTAAVVALQTTGHSPVVVELRTEARIPQQSSQGARVAGKAVGFGSPQTGQTFRVAVNASAAARVIVVVCTRAAVVAVDPQRGGWAAAAGGG
jgi:hypothetical protein